MRIAVVIAAHDEAGNIGRLVTEIFAVVPAAMLGEVIVVDDGSTDGTAGEVRGLLGRYSALRYLRHAARSGQSAALRTGILAASSPVVATMDGDGQNDPRDIARLLARLGPPGGSGPALVGGLRVRRRATASRRLASILANAIRRTILRDDCPDTGCGLKVFWRDAFTGLPAFTGMHRYLPVLFAAAGHPMTFEPVGDRPRLAGRSKYGNMQRALVGIFDLVGVAWLRRRAVAPIVCEDSAAWRTLPALAGGS